MTIIELEFIGEFYHSSIYLFYNHLLVSNPVFSDLRDCILSTEVVMSTRIKSNPSACLVYVVLGGKVLPDPSRLTIGAHYNYLDQTHLYESYPLIHKIDFDFERVPWGHINL